MLYDFLAEEFFHLFRKKSGRIAAPGVLEASEYKGLRVLEGDIPLKTRLVQKQYAGSTKHHETSHT